MPPFPHPQTDTVPAVPTATSSTPGQLHQLPQKLSNLLIINALTTCPHAGPQNAKKKPAMYNFINHSPMNIRLPRLIGTALAVLLTLSPCVLTAGDPKSSDPTAIEPAPAKSRIGGLFQIDISDHYITPRGLTVENQGVIFQPLFLLFFDLYDGDGFINDVSLTLGVWNSIHTEKSGADPGYWNEIDPIAGLSFGFQGGFKLDTTWTAFESMTDSYDTPHNLEVKLSYSDNLTDTFSINPFVSYWLEITNKTTFATTDSSYYFTVGINPTYSPKSIPVRFELPITVLFPADDFYGESSTVGLWSIALKASTPLTFISPSFGKWFLYGKATYHAFENDALVQFGSFATGQPDDDEFQFSTGITIIF
ncbi:hypothetical protein FEM03_14775 [Phragmitibacter flavus]|uniref:Uncharacterized protein n=1 Tax=Phragmitibacter flavus TaxID=2576071 RepID=A0A5R8KCF9_9BACT|nr:hypothetical protein [Phragmitibacter flavus]TLD69992.1 hypothetical protein FEM03_14775 [Phragmitibacter flavus]